MATAKLKLKAAQGWVAQSQGEAADGIRQVGDLTRQLTRLRTAMNDEIGAITQRYEPQITLVTTELAMRTKGVHFWCEANRALLTDGGKTKTANLVTGSVSWRLATPSVTVTKVDEVVKYLLANPEFARFLRQKPQINKEALLLEPVVAKTIPGITIKPGDEGFAIEPFEQQVAE